MLRTDDLLGLTASAAITFAGCVMVTEPPAAPSPAPVSIEHTLMLALDRPTGGTGAIDRTELLVAWYASQAFHDQLDALQASRDAAADADRSAIEARGPETQALAHRQLAGDEPLYTVLLGVQHEVETVMDEQGLWKAVLVSEDTPAGMIDITSDVVSRITPRQATDQKPDQEPDRKPDQPQEGAPESSE